MGTQRVHVIEALSRLVRWALHTGKRDFCPALAALVGPVQNIFFLTVHNFTSFVPYRPARWAGSRAGTPVSECLHLALA
jgi:hypothetical protein